MPGCDGAGMAERSYLMSEARGDGREEILHVWSHGQHPRPEAAAGRSNCTPEVVAVRAQEGLEEPFHVEGQEGWQ